MNERTKRLRLGCIFSPCNESETAAGGSHRSASSPDFSIVRSSLSVDLDGSARYDAGDSEAVL